MTPTNPTFLGLPQGHVLPVGGIRDKAAALVFFASEGEELLQEFEVCDSRSSTKRLKKQ